MVSVYVQLQEFNATEIMKTVVIIVHDLIVPCRFNGVLDAKERKRKSQEPLWVVCNHFFLQYTEEDHNQDNNGVTCGKCNGKPCDWTKYGPETMAFINEMCKVEDLSLTN